MSIRKHSLRTYLEQGLWLCVLTVPILVPSLFYKGSLNPFEIPKKTVLTTLLALAYCLAVPLRFRRIRNVFRDHPFCSSLVVVFLGLNVASAVLSIHPETSWRGNFSRQSGTETLCWYIIWYFLVRLTVDTERRKTAILWAIVLGAVLPLVHGFLQFSGIDLTSWESLEERIRPHGSMAFVNLLAGYLSVTIGACFVLALLAERRMIQLFLFALASFSCFMLLSTYSRGAWLALMVTFLLFFAISLLCGQWRFLLERRATLGVFFLSLLISVLAFGSTLRSARETEDISADLEAVTQRSMAERLASSLDFGELTVAGRLRMWQIGAEIIKDYPLWGSGPETFIYLYPEYRTRRDIDLFGKRAMLENLHNEIVHMAANTGLPATLVFLVLLAVHLLSGLQSARGGRDGNEKILYGALFALLSAYFLRSLVNVNSISNNVVLWALLAMIPKKSPTPSNPTSKPEHAFLLICVFIPGVLWLNAVLLRPYLASTEAQRAREELAEKEFDGALSSYHRATELDPGEEVYMKQLAHAYVTVTKSGEGPEENLTRALHIFDRLVERNPLDFQHRLDRGRTYVVFGDEVDPAVLSKALEDFEEVLRIAPYQSQVYGYVAQVHIRQENWKAAATAIREAIVLEPKNTFYRQTLGNVYMAEEHYAEAVREFERIIQLDSKDANAYNNLGVALVLLNDIKAAEEAFRKALSIVPGHEDARKNLNRLTGEATIPGKSKTDDSSGHFE